MRKVIAAINVTIDGFCDHSAGLSADEELHDHYAHILNNAGVILYGRTTFELMKFWQELLDHPSDDPSMNDFARSIDQVEKLVFSRSMSDTGWDSARLVHQPLEELVEKLRNEPGRDILVGSRSLIVQLLKSNLLDELQLCIHPVIEGKGLPLFDEIHNQISFKLSKTKTLSSGATVLYLVPASR